MHMNKTLIALAVAFSAVSGTAAAWTPDANSVQFEIGGTLTAAEPVTPWVAGTGTDFGNIQPLDAKITKGVNQVTFKAENAIPVLGIRSDTKFKGRSGIAPKINFGEAVHVDDFKDSSAPLTLVINDESGNKLGTLSTKIYAGAFHTKNNDGAGWSYNGLVASKPEAAFSGGLPKSSDAAGKNPGVVYSRLSAISVAFSKNFAVQRPPVGGFKETSFEENTQYSAYYGAGIEKGSEITILLDKQLDGEIKWKASLPIMVTYG